MTRIAELWAGARDLDAVVAERLGLIGPAQTRRRACAWGLAVLGVCLMALVLSPVVAGGQPESLRLAPVAVAPSSPSAGPNQLSGAPPVGNPDRYETAEDVSLSVPASRGVLANDRGFTGQPLLALADRSPGRGDLSLSPDGSFTYTPDPDVNGPDTFTYFVFEPDRFDLRREVEVLLGVEPANDAPVATPDRFMVGQDGELVVEPPGLLSNDVDVDGDELAAIVSGAARGSVDMASSGGFRYLPEPGFLGLDSFAYAADDGLATSRRVQVIVEVVEGDLAPSAAADGYQTDAGAVLVVPGPGVLANDEDPEGGDLSAVLDAPPGAGAIVLEPDGSLTYTPPPDFTGLDRFTYAASDGNSVSEPVSVTVVVGGDGAFSPATDGYDLDEDASLAVPAPGVLANDELPGAGRQAELVRAPMSGVVELRGDGSFIYVPEPDLSGTDSFEYVVVIGEAVSVPGTVELTIQPASEPAEPTPPTTSPPPAPETTVPSSEAPSAAVVPDDSGIPDDAAEPGEGDAPGGGAPGAPPSDSVASPPAGDGSAPSDGEAQPGGAEMGVTIDVAGDLFEGLDAVPVVSLEAPAPQGEVIVNDGGTVTYLPEPEFLGRDAFGYRVCTLDETCATGTVELVVSAPAEAGGPPEVRFQNVKDRAGVPWLALVLALAALTFAVVMAVVVVRAVRGPVDPFAGAASVPPAPSSVPPPTAG